MNIAKIFKSDMAKPFDDPFVLRKITTLHIHYWPKDSKCWGSIEFENGNTEGTQKFKTEDIPSMMEEMKVFMDQL